MAMAEATQNVSGDTAKKSSKMGLILSVVLCIAGAAMGYFALSSGIVPLGQNKAVDQAPPDKPVAAPDVAFVAIPTMIVTLPPGAQNDHLRFTALIEVPSKYQGDVEFLMPRIQDVLNGYLRALTAEDIEGPGALFKIRLQMFRRIVVVVGLGKANSLLVTEFILN